VAGVYATWLVLFRSRSRGLREGAMSILISAIVATWLASPALLLLGDGGTGGVTNAARCFTAGVAELALPPGTQDPEPARGPVDPGDIGPCSGTERISKLVTETLVDTFIRRPHQLLNYGSSSTARRRPVQGRVRTDRPGRPMGYRGRAPGQRSAQDHDLGRLRGTPSSTRTQPSTACSVPCSRS
jgi:hypothetical protein